MHCRSYPFARRGLASLLVALVLSPQNVVLAQSTGTPKPTVPPGSVTKSAAPVFLPGGGSVTDSGDASYTLPLWAPDGPADMQPKLAIKYSGRGNGSLGVGFGLTGLSSITPCHATFASEGYADGIDWEGPTYIDPSANMIGGDAFCLDGHKLVPYVDPYFERPKGYPTTYHTEIESFEHIVANRSEQAEQPDDFIVYERDGGQRLYLPFSGTQQTGVSAAEPATGGAVVRVRYLLKQRTDRNGNKIVYEYDNEGIGGATGGASEFGYRLRRIDYSFTNGIARRQIRFNYKPRVDLVVRYVNGVRFVSRSVISTIEAWAPNPTDLAKVWSYELGYIQSPDTGRTLLSSIKLFDFAGAPSWTRTFDWTERGTTGTVLHEIAEQDFNSVSMGMDDDTRRWYWETPGANWLRGNDTRVMLYDIDSDGDADALYRTAPSGIEYEYHRNANGEIQDDWFKLRKGVLSIRLSSATQPLAQRNLDITQQLEPDWNTLSGTGLATPYVGAHVHLNKSRLGDFDNDGRVDLMLARTELAETTGPAPGNQWKIYHWRYGFKTLWGQSFDHTNDKPYLRDPGFDWIPGDAPSDPEREDVLLEGPLLIGSPTADYPDRNIYAFEYVIPSFQRVLADLDGDGRTDVLDPFYRMHKDISDNFDYDWQNPDHQGHPYRAVLSSAPPPDPTGALTFGHHWTCGNDRALVMDFDGDGRQEALIAGDDPETDTDPYNGHRTYKKLSVSDPQAGYVGSSTGTSKLWGGDCNSSFTPDLVMGDWNGDGLLDALYPTGSYLDYGLNGAPNTETLVRWNLGNGFSKLEPFLITGSPAVVAAIEQKIPYGKQGSPVAWDRGTRVADVDGDGRSDIIAIRENIDSCVYARLNLPSNAIPPACENRIYVYRSRGNGFVGEEVKVWPDAGVGGATLTHGFTTAQVGDVTGDGSPDFVHVIQGHLKILELPWRQTPDLLEGVYDESSMFPLETFGYDRAWWGNKPRDEASPSQPYGPPVCDWPLSCTKQGFPVVRTHRLFTGTRSDGIAMYRTQLHTYDGIKRTVNGRGSLGFAKHVIWDRESGSQTTRLFMNDSLQDLDGSDPGSEFYPGAGMAHFEIVQTPRRTVATQLQLSGSSMAPGLSSSITYNLRTRWSSATHEFREDVSKRILTILPEILNVGDVENAAQLGTDMTMPSYVTSSQWGTGRTTKTVYDHDEFGNELSRVATTRDGSGSGSVVLTTSVVSEFDTPEPGDTPVAKWDRRRPLSVTQMSFDADDALQPMRVTRTKYDALGNPLSVAVRALAPVYDMCLAVATQEDCEIESAATTYARDDRGNVLSSTVTAHDDPEARVTMTTWDDDGVYPLTVTDAMGLSRTTLIHPAFGVPVIDIDANNQTTTTTYDGFTRMLSTSRPGTATITKSYAAYTSGNRRGLETMTASSTGAQEYTLTDELGRQVETRKKAFDGTTWIYSQDHYDVHGNLERSSLPYTSGTPSYVRATHDRLGQVLTRQQPGRPATRFTHSVVLDETTDPEGHVSYIKRDVAGRTIESGHYVSGTTTPIGEVRFTHAPFDQVESITDVDGNVTLRFYDAFGRQTTLRDPNGGSTSYEYDGFSQVRVETRPFGAIDHKYDRLGRLVASDGPDNLIERAYDYGLGANGQPSKIVATESASGKQVTTDLTYDSYGRLHGVAQTVDSTTDIVHHRYDTHGRLKWLFYPGTGSTRFAVAYDYNSSGYLSTIKDVTACGISSEPSGPTPLCLGSQLWRVDTRNVRGQPTGITWGGSMLESRAYDATTGAITSIDTVGKDTTYTYDDDGQLETRTEGTGRSERFAYDEMHRIRQWDLHVPAGKDTPAKDVTTTYEIDELGNLHEVVRGGLITFSATFDWNGRPHAMGWSNVAGNHTYDSSGRQVRAGTRTTTFNEHDLPSKIVTGTSTKTFRYDGDGRRALRVDGNTTTRYHGRLFERRITLYGATDVFHVYGESGAIAQVNQTGSSKTTRFVVSDPLGTASAIVKANPTTLEETAFYDPFGTRVNDEGVATSDPAVTTTRGFTGHEEESAGLVNMQGRIYDTKQFRFISPDPVVGNVLFGQSYNPYSYVHNNPLNIIDPSGFNGEAIQGGMDGLGAGAVGSVPPRAPEPPPEATEDPPTAGGREAQGIDPGGASPEPPKPPPPAPTRTPIKNVTPFEPIKGATPLTDAIVRVGRSIFDIKDPMIDQAFHLAVSTNPLLMAEQTAAMYVAMVQAPAIAADTAGQHYARAQLLDEEGADEAAFDERLAMYQEGATAIGEAAWAVASGGRKARWTTRPTLKHQGEVFKRQGGKCWACGVEMTRKKGPRQLNLDHSNPVSRHPAIHPLEAKGLCRTCNLEKSDMALRDWAWQLGRTVREYLTKPPHSY